MTKESLFYILKKAFSAWKNKGFNYFILTARNRIYRIIFAYFTPLKRKRDFIFENNELPYLYIKKEGNQWANERAIEIPIIRFFLEQHKNKKILEVGNVLSKFDKIKSVVVDKYEKAKGVINDDIIDYKPNEKFDVVFSISTLEHVGFDEIQKNKNGFADAVKNIKDNCLKKEGVLIFTVPFGYNPHMDKIIKKDRTKFDKEYYFKRISLSNKWIETSKKEALGQKYGIPYECANALLIGVIKNR